MQTFFLETTSVHLLTILVLQELWEVKEFWDELFDVIGVVHERLPGGRNRVKLSIRAVEPAPNPQRSNKTRSLKEHSHKSIQQVKRYN